MSPFCFSFEVSNRDPPLWVGLEHVANNPFRAGVFQLGTQVVHLIEPLSTRNHVHLLFIRPGPVLLERRHTVILVRQRHLLQQPEHDDAKSKYVALLSPLLVVLVVVFRGHVVAFASVRHRSSVPRGRSEVDERGAVVPVP